MCGDRGLLCAGDCLLSRGNRVTVLLPEGAAADHDYRNDVAVRFCSAEMLRGGAAFEL
jgi:hypothetical protein